MAWFGLRGNWVGGWGDGGAPHANPPAIPHANPPAIPPRISTPISDKTVFQITIFMVRPLYTSYAHAAEDLLDRTSL